MSLYIFEGPRSSGKSTAINTLKHALGDNVYPIKFTRTDSPPIAMTSFLAKHWLALVDRRSIAVFDRFHLTEYVMRSLDHKVEIAKLIETTSMIDVMLKHIGAVTYVLQASPYVRASRTRKRDAKHSKPEWPDVKELDAAWEYATNFFSTSEVVTMPSEDQADIDNIIIDIMKRQTKQGLLVDKWKASSLPFPKVADEVKPAEAVQLELWPAEKESA